MDRPKIRYEVLTLFPEVIQVYLRTGVLGKAVDRGIIDVQIYNIRDYCTDKHRQVDDYPYGGGPGMIIKPEPVFRAIESLKKDPIKRKIIMLSPSGRVFDQQYARKLVSECQCITLLSGRYEGFDHRVMSLVDEEVSIGDYVLTGGELAALVIIDATARLVPGVLGEEDSPKQESFTDGLLEYPQWTRPREFRGMSVPEVLLSGNHQLINRWRRKESIRRTLKNRPALLINLKDSDMVLLQEVLKEEGPEWLKKIPKTIRDRLQNKGQ